MNLLPKSKSAPFLTAGILATLISIAGPAMAQGVESTAEITVEGGAQAGFEVQMRGPVHEAFAEAVVYEPRASVIVEKAPPPAIEELPPDQKPEGDNVAWISGYWSWDDDRSDFIWISGVWRVIPPERKFIPGYWMDVSGGYQWVSGYWVEDQVEEVEYIVEEPPATLEIGANIAAPSEQHVWVPGCWMWRDARYLWRPGFWIEPEPGWIWVPAHYTWGASGYVYVDGYWDYDLQARGVLFAPVYYSRPVYRAAAYVYEPAVAVDLTLITDHLFMRPSCRHYYFGDYYAASYTVSGFMPWFSFHLSSYGYDPFYAYYRSRHLSINASWETDIRAAYRHRVTHIDARPRHTFTAYASVSGVIGGPPLPPPPPGLVLGRPLAEIARAESSPLRFERLDRSVQKDYAREAQNLVRYSKERQKLEVETAKREVRGRGASKKAIRVSMPESPVSRASVAKIDRRPMASPQVSKIPGRSDVGRGDSKIPGRSDVGRGNSKGSGRDRQPGVAQPAISSPSRGGSSRDPINTPKIPAGASRGGRDNRPTSTQPARPDGGSRAKPAPTARPTRGGSTRGDQPKAAPPKSSGGSSRPRTDAPKSRGGGNQPKTSTPKSGGGGDQPNANAPKGQGGRSQPKAATPKPDSGSSRGNSSKGNSGGGGGASKGRGNPKR